jgi:hypothetical protein
MSRRVVILSPGGDFTADLLALMARRGVEADALVLYLPDALKPIRSSKGIARLRAAALAPARWVAWRARRRLAPPFSPSPRQFWGRGSGGEGPPAPGATPVVLTGTVNGARMIRDLRRLEPDVVVLATCSLLTRAALDTAREGVVNMHPGLLPWARGNNPSGNSLVRGVPLGCTAFWVDEGIDTGPMLDRRLLRVEPGPTTLQHLRDDLRALWLEVTVDVIAAARSGADLPRVLQNRRFPLGRTIADPALLATIDHAAASGRAHELFERWRPFADPDLRLPPDADARIAAAFPDAGTPAATPARTDAPAGALSSPVSAHADATRAHVAPAPARGRDG